MAMTVKICGLSTEETLDAALDAGADMVGLVFVPGSPRFVTEARGAELRRRIGGRARLVALSADADDGTLDEIVGRVAPDLLQLHGRESPERVRAMQDRYRLPVIKAVGVRGPGDLAEADPYLGVADRILFDAKPPIGAIVPGGHGIPFNWRLLRGVGRYRPFMLAGGLDAGNVRQAITVTGADAVDVSSGVETAPGRKDPDLIRAFIAAARIAEHAAAPGAA